MEFINHTNNQKLHYLYQYIRLDKNEPFYIGVGKRYKSKNDFTRAKSTYDHNNICKLIINKTDYNIEILEESDDYYYIREREKELIAKYGKIFNGTGVLANFTDGGDGGNGTTNPQLYKKCYSYTKDGFFHKEFESITAAAIYFNIDDSQISNAIIYTDRIFLTKNHQFRNFKSDSIPPVLDIREKLSNRKSIPIIQLDRDGNLIKEWKSAFVAAKELNMFGSRRHICECCYGTRKTAGGFKWRFKEK